MTNLSIRDFHSLDLHLVSDWFHGVNLIYDRIPLEWYF